MARHGGGSRSGGSSSRSSGGSRSGGSSTRTSTTPFRGSYNRSYYHKGKLYNYYTEDKEFGTRGFSFGSIFALIFITFHMFFMVGGVFFGGINIGGKVDGNISRLKIVDNIDILTNSEENEILKTLQAVYEKSGMPITIYIDDFSWKNHYNNLAAYSEELYYSMGMDEESMILLFTIDYDNPVFVDWEYDVCCGDDTVKCLSDELFDTLLSNFQKAMAGQNLKYAITYSFESIINEMAKTTINFQLLIIVPFLLFVYSMFYIPLFKGLFGEYRAYKYFKQYPEKLKMETINVKNVCDCCGAQNPEMKNVCDYCNTNLRL